MSQVVSIFKETPVEFIRRNGPTLTGEIAQRFNLSSAEARWQMKQLEKAGLLKSSRVGFDYGAGLEWTAVRKTQT